MRSKKWIAVLALVVLAAGWTGRALAQDETKAPAKDYTQRALEIYEFKKAAQSGPERKWIS